MSKMTISLIAAMADDRIIGRNNTLPWHLPEDLKHFKATTLGKPVIMGRKTWESLGRPLPGRRNLVISRNHAYTATGGEVFSTLANAIATCSKLAECFVIGGAEIFQMALPLAQRIYLTEIKLNIIGDARFPALPTDDWQEISRENHHSDNGRSGEKGTKDDNMPEGLDYAFIVYERKIP